MPPHTASQDKACIDQKGDIDASLKVLPIFLLASKNLCVFAGASYTSRLWCIIEMFTFIRGGGSLDRISVYPLDIDAKAAVVAFGVEKCDCTVIQDKERLLAIVESSFGSFGEFNDICRNIFIHKLGGADGGSKDAVEELSTNTRSGPKSGNKYKVAPAPT